MMYTAHHKNLICVVCNIYGQTVQFTDIEIVQGMFSLKTSSVKKKRYWGSMKLDCLFMHLKPYAISLPNVNARETTFF